MVSFSSKNKFLWRASLLWDSYGDVVHKSTEQKSASKAFFENCTRLSYNSVDGPLYQLYDLCRDILTDELRNGHGYLYTRIMSCLVLARRSTSCLTHQSILACFHSWDISEIYLCSHLIHYLPFIACLKSDILEGGLLMTYIRPT